MAASGKKPYEKPHVETERIFETLSFNSGYCTFLAAAEDEGCNPDFGGSEYGG